MKKGIVLAVMVLSSVIGLKAQDCQAIVLPYYKNNAEWMATVPEDKIVFRCLYSQMAFYESDVVPEGVDVYNISQVREQYGTAHLPQNYVVDLTTLSYYAYNFRDFQMLYPTGGTTICFATPSSTHPYLVLRSLDETNALAEAALNNYYHEQNLYLGE